MSLASVIASSHGDKLALNQLHIRGCKRPPTRLVRALYEYVARFYGDGRYFADSTPTQRHPPPLLSTSNAACSRITRWIERDASTAFMLNSCIAFSSCTARRAACPMLPARCLVLIKYDEMPSQCCHRDFLRLVALIYSASHFV